jgi:hypothetical protein
MANLQNLALRLEGYMKPNMVATCNMTVTMKAIPHTIPANLKRVLSIRILDEYSCEKVRSSEVIISIIAMTASHKLRSVSVRGIFMLITITITSRPRIMRAHLN